MQEDQDKATSQASVGIPYPRGLLRLAMRLPIYLYRFHLCWLLGKRFLLLEHRGRKSGVLRKAVIEVVDHSPGDGSFIVAAAWGNRSDWYKNITVHPQVTIQVGSKRFSALALTLPPEEARRHLDAYAKKHPAAFKQLGSLLVGLPARETDKLIEAFVERMPLVQFTTV